MQSRIVVAGLVALLGLTLATTAQAQRPHGRYAPPRHAPARIEITPGPLLYRRCTSWYELQHRPSGTVLFPQMRCWWVRG